LITNPTPGINELFEIDKHLVVYKNNDELIEKIKYYLDNKNERKLIENQGYEFVKENHTYFQRAKQILKIIEENV
jgi:spore maturation protein CgeB